MAVTTGGLPVRLWVWPGNTTDTTVLEEVRNDLAGWQLNRTVWIADAGFASKDNRKILTQGGSGFIVAERLRGSMPRSWKPEAGRAGSAPSTGSWRSRTSSSGTGRHGSGS